MQVIEVAARFETTALAVVDLPAGGGQGGGCRGGIEELGVQAAEQRFVDRDPIRVDVEWIGGHLWKSSYSSLAAI